MADGPLRVAILVVSDTAFQDASTDQAIPILKDVFTTHGQSKWSIVTTDIVPDDQQAISNKVRTWCQDRYNLVLTTGGTGFATKDVTPEAITPLLEKHAPGLVHGMLAKSLEITPFAMMSRPVAGVSNGTIVVTLPGSPKGAKENLEAIVKLLPHACLQAAGMNSRALHAGGTKKLEQDAGVTSSSKASHSHAHHHAHDHAHGHSIPRAHTQPQDRPQSNNPAAGPSQRYRESPYPMLPVQDAITTILQHSPEPEETEMIVSTSLIDYILAEDVEANEAVPAFRASIVDGYAIVIPENGSSSSSKGVFPVVSVSHAAPGTIQPLQIGQIARITTGAPLPDGATSVVMVEDTVLKSTILGGTEEKEVEILTDAIKINENVREVGSDIEQGSIILSRGDRIGPGELGLLASVGVATVKVFSKPTIGVLSTGDEIIQHDRAGRLKLGEVRDCNRPAIMSVLKSAGYDTVDCGIARDSPGNLESCLRDALRVCDIIITSGGASMGELDLLKPTIERALGGTIHFGRVSMKPGKPTTFATVRVKDNNGNDQEKLIFSLPGNPASAITCVNLFVLPSLAKTSGHGVAKSSDKPEWKYLGRTRLTVLLEESVQCDKSREEYQRAVVRAGDDGRLLASATGGQRSSRIGSFQKANALIILPAGGGTLNKGSQVEALLINSFA